MVATLACHHSRVTYTKQNRPPIQLNHRMLHLHLVALLFMILALLATISNTLPTKKPTDGKTEPQTAAAQLLKLACQKAEKLKQEEKAHELSRQEMLVQEKDGPRHDRKWATTKKIKKGSSTKKESSKSGS